MTSITFELDQLTCRIPSEVAFQIKVTSHGKKILHTIVDEGASTCVMSFKCWQALRSPTLVQSHSLRKVFDGHSFSPHELIVACPIEWGRKTVTVDVEVADVPTNYNFLLGLIWIHAMMVSFFRFPSDSTTSLGGDCHDRPIRLLHA